MTNFSTSLVRILMVLLLTGLPLIVQAQESAPNWGELSKQNSATKTDASDKTMHLHGTDEVRVGKPGETGEQRNARLKWWREARFGMFIHWGLYSEAAGYWNSKKVNGGEWIQSVGKIPGADYAKLAEKFDPQKFNADEWVKLAKDAGMKYIVITAKHHDGFAMFATKFSDYNVVGMTPFKRDPLKELAEACKKQGIKLGFYYSQNLDWHNPYARGNEWEFNRAGADFPRYMKEQALPQMRELLTNYGEVCEFWFDFPLFATQQEADTFTKLCWELQPNIILNDRAGGKSGDFCTPEQSIPGDSASSDLEACMTLNDNWGYCAYDQNWKPTYNLIRNLINTTSKDGNFLLNVGPDGQGEIPPECVTRLREVGKWLEVNGESIYNTDGSPFGQMPWGRVTTKPGRLFLHVYEWPANGELEVPMGNTINGVKILTAPDIKVGVAYGKGFLTLKDLPKQMPDKNDTVIELAYSTPFRVGAFRGQRLMCPDFEDDYPEGWSTFHQSDFVSGSEAIDGRRSLVIRYGGNDGEGFKLFYQTVHVNPGDKMDVEASMKTVNCDETGAMLEIEFHDANGRMLYSQKSPHQKGNSNPLTVSLKEVFAPRGTVTATVKATLQKLKEGNTTHPQSVLVDNFTLTNTPGNPEDVPLLANPTFKGKSSLDGWETMGNGWSVQNGRACAKWVVDDPDGFKLFQQTIAVKPGQMVNLEASVEAKNAEQTEGLVELEFNSEKGDGLGLHRSDRINGTNGPKTLTISNLAVPEDAAYLRIKGTVIRDSDVREEQYFYFDDFKLKISPAK